MKDPDDCYTLDMLPAAAKRGRGRPRKVNALTPAQRARRYRMRKSAGRCIQFADVAGFAANIFASA